MGSVRRPVAVLRVRRGAVAALLGGWLGAFLVVKGFSTAGDIEANTFWRLLMPAWPAYLLLVASIPLLVPTLARRLGERCDAHGRLPDRAALDRARGGVDSWPFPLSRSPPRPPASSRRPRR